MGPVFATMQSGKRCLVLEEGITYDSFLGAAEKWAAALKLVVTQKIDGPDSRLWTCELNEAKFWLAYDEWTSAICLEPQDSAAEQELERIGAAFEA